MKTEAIIKILKKMKVIDMEFQAETVEHLGLGSECIKCGDFYDTPFKYYQNRFYCKNCWEKYKQEILNIEV